MLCKKATELIFPMACINNSRKFTFYYSLQKIKQAFSVLLIKTLCWLILDEPTDGLDPNQKHHVRELIREMSSDRAIVISTHILEEVDAVCTRAIIIDRGAIVADGTADELRKLGPGKKGSNSLELAFRSVTAHSAVDSQSHV